MNIYKFYSYFLIILVGGCSVAEKDYSYGDTMSVIDQYSLLIKKKEKIRNSGYGLHYAGADKIYDEKIHTISLAYCVDKSLKYDEARKYFYSIVDGLLEHVNKNTQLAKYFYHFPVDYSDLEFHFTFHDDRECCLHRDDVDSIHIIRNEIYYEIMNEDGPNDIKYDQVSPDIYIMKGALARNRSIIRTISEDLAMHQNK